MVPLFEPHNFWDSQPVPKVQDEFVLPDSEFNKPIIEQNVEDISTEPLTLPPEYFWESLDLNDDSVAQEMYDLLVRKAWLEVQLEEHGTVLVEDVFNRRSQD